MEQSKFYQIKNITEHEYTLVGCDGSVITRPIQDVDKSASAFTIQDAKDGDVLVFESGVGLGNWYCIFQSFEDKESMTVHCYISINGEFEINKKLHFYQFLPGVNPATKEQRDTLERAITNAGYVWDAENKKLKKIESQSIKEECSIPDIVDEHFDELVDLAPEKNNMTEFEIRFAGIMCKEIPVCELCTEKSVIIAQKYSKELISIARKQFIKEACEWLSKNADEYTWCHEDGRSGIGYNMIEDFRKALKKGE